MFNSMTFVILFSILQLQVPAPVGVVNDFAGVLDASHERAMAQLIEEVRQKSRGEIAVVTLPYLGGRASIDVSRDIVRVWVVVSACGAGPYARYAVVFLPLIPGPRPGDGQPYVVIGPRYGPEGICPVPLV